MSLFDKFVTPRQVKLVLSFVLSVVMELCLLTLDAELTVERFMQKALVSKNFKEHQESVSISMQ